jgi:predicted phage-related endonuclease
MYAVPPEPLSPAEDGAERAQWLASRAGRLTGSRMADAMSFNKDGRPSIKRSDYMRDLLAERLTGLTTRHYVTPAMQWGIDHEAEAKLVYASVTGHKILPQEFMEHPAIENFGATADGFINPGNGLLECKCPTTGTFIEWKLAGVVPEQYKPQMIVEAICAQRSWVDFFAYDPRIKEEKKRYLLLRFEPTAEQIAIVEKAANEFLAELDQLWERFITS